MLNERIQNAAAQRMVRANLKLYRAGFDLRSAGLETQTAARWLFSILADLEEMAVVAARKGAGVRFQLRDELAHRDTFAAIAEDLGGKLRVSDEVQELTWFLEDLEGEAALACLNIVAEHWLAGVFEHIADKGVTPELFAKIGLEERRHVSQALQNARPDPADLLPILRALETRLAAVANSPEFMLPLVHLYGSASVAELGLRNARDHRAACSHLGLEPGPRIHRLEATCRAARRASRKPAIPKLLTAWQASRFSLWPDDPAPMVAFVDANFLELPQARALVEARVLHAVSRALATHPELNVTVRGQGLYRPSSVLVGVRRMAGGGIVTHYLEDMQRLSVLEARDLLHAKHDRATLRIQEEGFKQVPRVPRELWSLVPPSRSAATVTNVSNFGADSYLAPLSALEGSPISVTIGRRVQTGTGFRCHLGVQMDHRAGDGEHIGLLAAYLKQATGRNP